MLGLKLREEFLGAHMPGTAITLRTSDNQGAAQKSPDHILSITYPTADVQTALKAISAKNAGRPIILMGDRGRGKSHIMAVMHHGIKSSAAVESWLKDWGNKIGSDELKHADMLKGYVPISEPVHNHEYPLLWDLLFDRHPKGQYYRGQFESMAQPFPPRTLLEKMFEDQPSCLILDEFQTWYSGLPDKDPGTGLLLKQYAFNFVQILSEIATDRPEILILVISVLNNQNDAFQQIHRQGPVIIDFRGPSAKQDRQKLLLHRLFENRRNIPEPDILTATSAYAGERFRLLHPHRSEVEKERVQQEVSACWPFSPELLNLLEDHILLSSAAQETRDLIRILAQVFRSRGEVVPIITPADFLVDGDSDQVQTLIDSIADSSVPDKLRQIAQRNLEAVRDAGVTVPNARELISAIWMRSMSPGKNTGGTPATIHLDITRGIAVDDNTFQAELALLIENSVNIHGDEVPGGPLWFGMNENPRSKVRACAKNGKLWHVGAVPTAGQVVYPGKDVQHVRNTLRHIFVPETTSPPSRVIILGAHWKSDPWTDVDEGDHPARWDRPVLLVVPEQIQGGATGMNATLGAWLARHVQKRRNTVRFLLPAPDTKSLFADDELLYLARCSFLCAREGWGSDSVYRALHPDFDRPLRASLKTRFNRFAVLRRWDYQQPQKCVFDVEKIPSQGGEIPAAVEARILTDLFDPADFTKFVLKRAKDSDFVGSLMDDLMEPPPPNAGEAIPFLGETRIYERVLDIAAAGNLVLNVSGTWIGRRSEDTRDEDALRYIRSRAFRTGQEMRQIQLGLPGGVGGGTITVPNPDSGGGTQTETGGNSVPVPPGIGPAYPPAAGDKGGTLEENGDTGGAPGIEGAVFPPSMPAVKRNRSEQPATGINLSGCFEKWGVSTGQTIETARIEFSGLTAQQIKQILQRIPSAFKATLDVTYKNGGGK
ncbi:MAG: ATP-binding protein [Desulfotignum sp.]|nr:ATP-binding protein [Desulfotignum sp.]MCF8088495.1 ATP-binding protein [Desulfotignum sp.]MCF8137917.1 ATP-binding protein [Desulfotignum sp.]